MVDRRHGARAARGWAASCTRSAPTRTPRVLAGIRVSRRVLGAFVASGAIAGLAGVLYAARFGTLDAAAGTGIELAAVSAVVVGGVAIFGGSGTVYGAALGALLLATIRSALRDPAGQPVLGAGHQRRAAAARDRPRPPAWRCDWPRELRKRSVAPCLSSSTPRSARWETVTVFLLLVRDPLRRRPRRRTSSPAATSTRSSPTSSEIAIIALPLTLDHHRRARSTCRSPPCSASPCALMGYLWNHGWAMEMIIPTVLVVGALAGALNGVLVTRLGLPVARRHDRHARPSTAASRTWSSATRPSRTSRRSSPTGASARFAGTQIPNPFVLFVVLAVVFGVVLHFTGIGRSIFAMGANEEAARFSGVRVKRIKFWLFVVTGMVSALAGIVFTFRFASRARRQRRSASSCPSSPSCCSAASRSSAAAGNLLGVICAVLLLGTLQQRADAQRRLRRGADHRHGQPAAALRPRPERHRSRPRGAATGTRRRPTPNPHHHLTPCEEGNVHSNKACSRRSRSPSLLGVTACGSTKDDARPSGGDARRPSGDRGRPRPAARSRRA